MKTGDPHLGCYNTQPSVLEAEGFKISFLCQFCLQLIHFQLETSLSMFPYKVGSFSLDLQIEELLKVSNIMKLLSALSIICKSVAGIASFWLRPAWPVCHHHGPAPTHNLMLTIFKWQFQPHFLFSVSKIFGPTLIQNNPLHL